MRCSGAYGNVKYYATNLPYGVQLQGDKIKIVDKNAVENGIQTIRLKAQDSYGHSDERLIVLVINKKTIKKVVA